jgi:hypothetical protein
MTPHDRRVQIYLLALSRLCREVADEPRLLLPFLRILAMVPATLRELQREQKRMAA